MKTKIIHFLKSSVFFPSADLFYIFCHVYFHPVIKTKTDKIYVALTLA